MARFLPTVLKSDSESFYEEWERHVDFRPQRTGMYKTEAHPVSKYIGSDILRATARQLNREDLVLRLWKKLDILRSCGDKYVGDALVNVASTTQSIKLAKYLLDCGAAVDYRRSKSHRTPLHQAAKASSTIAAEFMRFLLLNGADPEANSLEIVDRRSLKKEGKRIRDEIGPKNISKWLNMSWDELIMDCKDRIPK